MSIKNLKIGTKLGMGFGLLILLAAALGMLGWSAMSKIETQLDAYARWGEIDEVMNEAVRQRSLVLAKALSDNHLRGTVQDAAAQSKAFEEMDAGLAEWRATLEGKPELLSVADRAKIDIDAMHKLSEEYASAKGDALVAHAKWDSLIQEILAYLLATMEDVIDPAKDQAEQAADIPEMVRWGAVDMLMNEAVIANVLRLQVATHDFIAHGTASGWKAYTQALATARQGLGEWRETFSGLVQMEQAADRIEAYLKEYESLGGGYRALAERRKGIDEKISTSLMDLEKTLENGMAQQVDPAKDKAVHDAHTTRAAFSKAIVGGLVFAILAGILVAWLTTLTITRPLRSGLAFAREVAKGNMAVRIDVDREDEVGLLSKSLQNMVGKIQAVVGDIQTATYSVSAGSTQLSTASQSLSQAATEQATNVEQVSASMEQIAASISKNSDNAKETERIARQASTSAQEGGDAVKQTVTAMKEIAGKISIVEEIARQTNLLALNAAIEAARAGDHGKGFAVVAAEVRKLAERSGMAAAEISELSTRSVRVAEKAGEMLTQMVPDIRKTAELVQEIAATSTEQNTGASMVSKAMHELDKAIQSNASTSEEAAALAEMLSNQSEQLQSTIGFFRLEEASTAAPQNPPARATRTAVAAIPQETSRGDILPPSVPVSQHDMDDKDFERF